MLLPRYRYVGVPVGAPREAPDNYRARYRPNAQIVISG